MLGLKPNYQTRTWTDAEKQGQLRLILAPTESKEKEVISINQDVRVYASLLKNGESATLDIARTLLALPMPLCVRVGVVALPASLLATDLSALVFVLCVLQPVARCMCT